MDSMGWGVGEWLTKGIWRGGAMSPTHFGVFLDVGPCGISGILQEVDLRYTSQQELTDTIDGSVAAGRRSRGLDGPLQETVAALLIGYLSVRATSRSLT